MKPGLITVLLAASACSRVPAPGKADPEPVRITQFYGATDSIGKGDSVTLCYGTENAVAVKMEPYSDSLKPSLTRCVADSPAKDTEYTLTATGADGSSAHQSFRVKVGPPTLKGTDLVSRFDLIGDNDVAAGSKVRFCYATVPGVKVALTPPLSTELAAGKHCFEVQVPRTTTFLLTVTSATAVDRIQNTVRTR